jgi:hypothetical protein
MGGLVISGSLCYGLASGPSSPRGHLGKWEFRLRRLRATMARGLTLQSKREPEKTHAYMYGEDRTITPHEGARHHSIRQRA